jgi:hypothetical protein
MGVGERETTRVAKLAPAVGVSDAITDGRVSDTRDIKVGVAGVGVAGSQPTSARTKIDKKRPLKRFGCVAKDSTVQFKRYSK